MKKYSIKLIIIGIIMISIALLYPKITDKPKENETSNESLKWSTLSGEDITVTELYNSEIYKEDYFYSNDNNQNKYTFLLPAYIKTNAFGKDIIEYNGEISVKYSKLNEANIDDYFKKYPEQYQNNYDTFYVKKASLKDNNLIYVFKAQNSTTNNYLEEIFITVKELDNNYSYVSYQSLGSGFSNEFIDKIINGFKVESGIANSSSCTKNNDHYDCIIKIYSLAEAISYKVDANKYNNIPESYVNTYNEKFIPIINNIQNNDMNVNVSFTTYDQNYLENFSLLSSFTSSKITLNNKNIMKFYKVDNYLFDSIHTAYYIINLKDDLSVLLNITSSKNNLDEIAKDFVNCEITGIN